MAESVSSGKGEAKYRHIPYFATPSFRKIALNLTNDLEVTRLDAKTEAGEGKRIESDPSLGLEIYRHTVDTIKIKYKGARLRMKNVLEKLDSEDIHDIAIEYMRIRAEKDSDLVNALSRKWLAGRSGREIDLGEANIPVDGFCYIDFVSEPIPSKVWEDHNVNRTTTFEDFYKELNRCGVCGVPLGEHGIKHRTLNAKKYGLDLPWIKQTFEKKYRPKIDIYRNTLASWIHSKVTKPTELASPNGMFDQKKAEKEEWVTFGV